MKQFRNELAGLDYLLGGVGLLALLTTFMPSLLAFSALVEVQALLLVLLLASCYALWWALHRFEALAERVIAVACVVLGLYLILGLLLTMRAIWVMKL